jgi:L-ascorbate metabolism protein UlaG (beta-lactamase superfamily)
MRRRHLSSLTLVVLLALSFRLPPLSASESSIRMTWVSVSTWLMEIGDTRFLIDAFFTRPPQPLFLPGSGGAYTFQPNPSDPETVNDVLDALRIGPRNRHGRGRESDGRHDRRDDNQGLDYILSGHSHYDHSLDIPLVSELTGAQIVGPRSTCLQAEAEGLSWRRCTEVNGGEVLTLEKSRDTTIKVYVIHSDHSGDATSILHVPRELGVKPQVRPPNTEGGLHVGVLEDMPNGGGTRVYLITVKEPRRPAMSIAIETSGSSTDFEAPIAVRTCIGVAPTPACDVDEPGAIYPSPADSFRSAMRAAGLQSIDLFIGFATGSPAPTDLSLKEQEFAILHPRFFIPTHLGGLNQPIAGGLDVPFQPSNAFLALLQSYGTTLLAPQQFLDAFELDSRGLRAVDNQRAKRRLGLPN